MTSYLYHIIIGSVLLAGCVKDPDKMEGPTIGSLSIVADEDIAYIVTQEEDIFERTYKHAKLDITYMPEFEMFRHFMDDSVKVIMTTRPLSNEEIEFFAQKKSHPRQTAFATSALAFVIPKNARDTVFTYEQLITMFRDSASRKIFVIENARSGISSEIMKVANLDTLPSHFYAFDSKQEVIEYVQEHDNAIGIVDWSDISDSDNPEAKEILETINLVAISRPVDSIQHGYLRPYQYNLQDRKYPFTRDLYFISRTGRTDLSMGFASFVAGEIGQRIILKSGLLPKYQDERILEITNTSDIKVVK
jgi:phosphate transport system substrate-binding protein